MPRKLLEVYNAGLLNQDRPQCLFPETLLFNEGWLLRAVLMAWKARGSESRFGFLPFPEDTKLYSEGQLYTPFKARSRGDKQAESHTHVDGIVGHFSIGSTKSGIVLEQGFKYIAAFEAKMYSPLSSGTANAPTYDQVSRTAACLINSVLQARQADGYAAHLVILYPEDNRRVDATQHEAHIIEERIAARIQAYLGDGGADELFKQFAEGWKDALRKLQVWFLTWEEVLAEIGDDELNQFYEMCKRFGRLFRSPQRRAQPDLPLRRAAGSAWTDAVPALAGASITSRAYCRH